MENREDLSSKKYPFEIKMVDTGKDMSAVTFRVDFQSKLPEGSGEKFEDVVTKWAEKGIQEGYGGKFMHSLDERSDWEGRLFNWGKDQKWIEFFGDLGYAHEASLEELYKVLAEFGQIKKLTIRN